MRLSLLILLFQKWVVVFGFHVIWIVMGLFYTLLIQVQRKPSFFNHFVHGGRELFFLNMNISSKGLHLNDIDEPATIKNIVTATIALSVELSFEFFHDIAMIIFGTSCLTLWLATSNFMKLGQNEANNKLRESLKELIRLAKSINSTWGGVFLWVVLYVTIQFSKELDALMQSSDNFLKLYFLLYFFYLPVGLILSAECSRKV